MADCTPPPHFDKSYTPHLSGNGYTHLLGQGEGEQYWAQQVQQNSRDSHHHDEGLKEGEGETFGGLYYHEEDDVKTPHPFSKRK